MAGLALILGAALRIIGSTANAPELNQPGDMLIAAGVAWGAVKPQNDAPNSGLFKDR